MMIQIGSQKAGLIQNVEGNVTMRDVTVSTSWDLAAVRTELELLEREAAKVSLPPHSRAAVDKDLASAKAEAARAAPDRGKVARLVERATRIVDAAGGLVDAGSGLVESLHRTAAVLGPPGKALLALLPVL
jgi:hypothetical protein